MKINRFALRMVAFVLIECVAFLLWFYFECLAWASREWWNKIDKPEFELFWEKLQAQPHM